MRNGSLFALLAILVPLLAGCPQVGNIRLIEDAPDDLEMLLEQHEYARARQLTGKYPSIDTQNLQARLTSLELAYTEATMTEARALEANKNLLGAVRLLSDALQKIPHSKRLRKLRNGIERDRVQLLQANERQRLVARGQYILEQQQLYKENVNLNPTSQAQQREYERYQKEAVILAGHLREHARIAMQQHDLAATQSCLELSRALHDDPEASALQTELQVIEQSLKQSRQQKARIRRKQTEKLLTETQQAINTNQLQEARAALTRIPPSSGTDEEVMALHDSLEQAVDTRVEQLLTTGDALYRADNISAALKTWTEALSLDPKNTEIRERTVRATKVLARLQELKRQQRK